MEFSSFLTSLGTSFIIFIILMLLFTWLSAKRGNAVVYYPNRILKGLEPWEGGLKTRNPLAWIREALSSTEQDIIKMSGIDTAVYFVFLGTGFFSLFFSFFFFFGDLFLFFSRGLVLFSCFGFNLSLELLSVCCF